ncbi:sugar phosphate isomerase [Planctomycetota bacterium]
MSSAAEKAQAFLENEQAFRLGSLMTEAMHPKTSSLSQTIQADMEAGIRLLQSVDEDIVDALDRLFGQPAYTSLVAAMGQALLRGGRIFFTGCGATGRLSILLEAAWREYWQRQDRSTPEHQEWAERCVSVMAGGDHALIKSVEGFEDFLGFGRYQLQQAGVQAGDLVVAISEGGETPFVIGTAWEGLSLGARVFFIYNNPTDLLIEHVERSRCLIQDPRVKTLDLSTGPMAITGSTRMQATTTELLVVGAALEQALCQGAKNLVRLPIVDYRQGFIHLVEALSRPAAVKGLAELALVEALQYRQGEWVTYAADWGLLDVLTDTTERSPTFMVPAFRPRGEDRTPASWAFVKNPTCATQTAWQHMLRRDLRGLEWDKSVYQSLGAPAVLQQNPPALDNTQILRFQIGNEHAKERQTGKNPILVIVGMSGEMDTLGPATRQRFHGFSRIRTLTIGPSNSGGDIHFPCDLPHSPLQLWQHLGLKLVMNTLSTATMAYLGRVLGNAMVWVSPGNKKLIDRGCRLIAQTVGCSYEQACLALHQQVDRVAQQSGQGLVVESPVALAIKSLQVV